MTNGIVLLVSGSKSKGEVFPGERGMVEWLEVRQQPDDHEFESQRWQ
jgi:hypothetical protein